MSFAGGLAMGGSAATWEDSRAATRALSTADVCWALCSEKRHLVVERLLPGVEAQGRWSWPEARRAGLAWWLLGADDCAESLVRRLAQSATQRLRRLNELRDAGGPLGREKGATDRQLRAGIDETIFWYVVGQRAGSSPKMVLSQLRALLKTGVLRGEPALEALLGHERSEEVEFMRKNAFRLLQLQRFHLAAALFLLCGHLEDAVRVAVRRIGDLQLALVLARRERGVVIPFLREQLEEASVSQDPWLHLLLSWHVGDREACYQASQKLDIGSSAVACEVEFARDGASPPLDRFFDGVLRTCSAASSATRDNLAEVANLLLGQST